MNLKSYETTVSDLAVMMPSLELCSAFDEFGEFVPSLYADPEELMFEEATYTKNLYDNRCACCGAQMSMSSLTCDECFN